MFPIRSAVGIFLLVIVLSPVLGLAAHEGGAAAGSVAAQQTASDKGPAAEAKKSPPASVKAAAGEVKAGSADQRKEPATAAQNEEGAIPIQTEAIDQAGQVLGKQVDDAGKGASRAFGKWVTAEIFAGVTWLRLILCAVLMCLVFALERFLNRMLATRLRFKAEGKGVTWNCFIEAVSSPLILFIRVYGLYWAMSPILGQLDQVAGLGFVHKAAGKAADLGGTISLFWFIYRFVNVLDVQLKRWASSTQNTIDDMLVPLVGKTLRGIILVIGGIMIIQNMTGIEIGPLIASLGIGGLAVALAGKDSIANLLGSLTILLDKPFQVGERIIIDNHDGVVEDVGFRSTRIRTLNGNLVSIPNEKIINSTLENVGKRTHVRWKTTLTLNCDTPVEKVERAIEIVRELLEDHEASRPEFPPRVYFEGFGEWSLNLTVCAWYNSSDYWKYQAWVQHTCLEIMRHFRNEQIELAFPTQTVYQMNIEQETEPLTLPMARAR